MITYNKRCQRSIYIGWRSMSASWRNSDKRVQISASGIKDKREAFEIHRNAINKLDLPMYSGCPLNWSRKARTVKSKTSTKMPRHESTGARTHKFVYFNVRCARVACCPSRKSKSVFTAQQTQSQHAVSLWIEEKARLFTRRRNTFGLQRLFILER